MFKKFISVALAGLVAASVAHAQTPQPDTAPAATTTSVLEACKAKAVGADGKPLYGAALNSFVKKCQRDTLGTECDAKAVGKDGKPLRGAAKNSFMKKCEGDIHKAECEGKAVSKDGKPLRGAALNSFMKKCMGPAAQ